MGGYFFVFVFQLRLKQVGFRPSRFLVEELLLFVHP